MTRHDRPLSLRLESLAFPSDLPIPAKHFLLFLAADLRDVQSEQLITFAGDALARGMVSFSAWGEDCERMHDCVDEAAVLGEIEGRWSGHLMTTWHAQETLEEAATFFRDLAQPSAEYAKEDCCWIALSVKEQSWIEIIHSVLQQMRAPNL
jgi:hypothetical protein